MRLVGGQLYCNRTHLRVDIVLPHSLGEGPDLAFDVSGVLALQRRGSELMSVRAMTGCAGWDPAPGVTGKDQANSRITLP